MTAPTAAASDAVWTTTTRQSRTRGCESVRPGWLDGLIVLVERGACNFSEKVANIALAGGVIGIIGLVTTRSPSRAHSATARRMPATTFPAT